MYGYKVFHTEIMKNLINAVRKGMSANAYIFYGQRGLGRHEAAKLFASALVCDRQSAAPCGECRSCIESKAGTNPDIIYVQREKDKASFGIGPIRAMIADCQKTPFYAKRKVYIIDEGDLLTAEAQNAFLKSLEEPPEYAVFIIICEQAENLLETVRSRSVKIAFPPVSDSVVRGYIEEKYPDESRLDFIVKYCAGIPGAADEIIAREDFEQLREETLSLVPKLLTKNKVHAYKIAEYVDKHKDNAQEICDMLLLYLRDALITCMGSGRRIINTDKSDKINILASTYSSQLIAKAADEILFAKKMLQKYIKPSAAVLHAALKIQ